MRRNVVFFIIGLVLLATIVTFLMNRNQGNNNLDEDEIIRLAEGGEVNIPPQLNSEENDDEPRVLIDTETPNIESNFTRVGVVRTKTPSSWSENESVIEMNKYLAVGRVREAENIIRNASVKDSIVEYYLGVFDAEVGNQDEAIYHLTVAKKDPRLAPYAENILEIYPFFDTFQDGRPEFLDALLSKALLNNGEVEIARDKLYFVTQNYGGYADAWMLLGAAELLLNHPDKAEADLRNTLPTTKADAYYWLGLATAAQGKYNESIAFFRQALDRGASPFSRVAEKAADSAFAANDMKTAEEYYVEALEYCRKEPGCSQVDLAVRPVWINLEFLRNPARGLEIAEQTLASNPNEAMAENLVAWSLIRLHRYEDAAMHVDKALSLNPDLAAAHLNAGTLAWLKGDLIIAKNSFNRAGQLDQSGAVGEQALKNIGIIDKILIEQREDEQ